MYEGLVPEVSRWVTPSSVARRRVARDPSSVASARPYRKLIPDMEWLKAVNLLLVKMYYW